MMLRSRLATLGCPGEEEVCESGRSIDCTCPDGSTGAQVCRDDSSGWEDCACSSSDGDADADSDGDVDGGPECTSPADCLDPTASACNSGECIACTQDECDDHSCVIDADLDDDGSECTEDCDDLDGERFPGNVELCDGVDNDCDGEPERDFGVIRGALVNPDGTIEVPMERLVPVSPEWWISTAANGAGSIGIAWVSEDETNFALVSDDLASVGPTQYAGSCNTTLALAGEPESFLLACLEEPELGGHQLMAIPFDDSGTPGGEIWLDSASSFDRVIDTAWTGEGYVVIRQEEETALAHILTRYGVQVGDLIEVVTAEEADGIRLDEFVVATTDGRSGPGGMGLVMSITNSEGFRSIWALRVGLDGHSVGAPLQLSPVSHLPGSTQLLAVAPSANGVMAVWNEYEAGFLGLSVLEACF